MVVPAATEPLNLSTSIPGAQATESDPSEAACPLVVWFVFFFGLDLLSFVGLHVRNFGKSKTTVVAAVSNAVMLRASSRAAAFSI